MKHSTLVLALCLVRASTAQAQSSPPASANQTVAQAGWMDCENSYEAPGAYSRCALRVEKDLLLRGDQGVVLGVYRFFRPLPLEKYAIGDEAKHYARVYQRAELGRNAFKYVGAFLVAVAVVGNQPCGTPVCHRSKGYVRNNAIVGGSMLAVSIPFRIRGAIARNRTIELSNARFSK